MEKKLKILVIDDTYFQREQAVKDLGNHDLTVVASWIEGREQVINGGWDIVLTDMMMPEVDWCRRTDVNKMIDYGFPIAMMAIKAGVQKVAIVSNGTGKARDDHHKHAVLMAAECDEGVGEIIPGRFWIMAGDECPHLEDEGGDGPDRAWGVRSSVKDWARVLEIIMT